MRKNILLFLIGTIFVGCGEDVDIASFAVENHVISSGKYTKPGEAKNVTSTSATIPILRQSASSTEYMWVIPSTSWRTYGDIYSSSYSTSYANNGVLVQEIPNKTDVEIIFYGLTPATTYYCVQSTSKDHIYQYSYSPTENIGSRYVTFTTPERIGTIYDVKKLGLHHLIITADADKLCYSPTNSEPTINDYTWTVTNGEATVTDLVANQKYYVRPYYGGKYGNTITVQTSSSDKFANAVDLGTSVKWADRMLLAENKLPSKSNYSFYFGSTDANSYSYNTYSSRKSSSDIIDSNDAAVYHWGGNWRMPTKEEVEELAGLRSVKTKIDGVEGLLIYGKSGTPYSNNTLFIPDYRYWTRKVYPSSYSSAYYFYTNTNSEKIAVDYNYGCLYIIPVQQ